MNVSPDKGHILIMDDDESILRVLTRILKLLGFTSSSAPEGRGAVAAYKAALESSAPFDAVILDLNVPGGMGGKETLREILEFDENVKAIVSSGESGEDDVTEYKKQGFKTVLGKPYSLDKVRDVLKEVLG